MQINSFVFIAILLYAFKNIYLHNPNLHLTQLLLAPYTRKQYKYFFIQPFNMTKLQNKDFSIIHLNVSRETFMI